MLSDGVIILLFFILLTVVPLTIVFTVLHCVKKSRAKKMQTYKGVAEGKVVKFVHRLDHPSVVHLEYTVDGKTYLHKESAKLQKEAIKVKGIPVGTRRTFVLGAIKAGDMLRVQYDENNPQKAIIIGNNGVMTS